MRWLAAGLLVGLWGAIAFGQTSPGDPPQREKPPGSERSTPGKSVAPPRLSAAMLLYARLPQIQFDNVPLDDAFCRLGEIAGANIVVRWQKLEQSGVQRDHSVSINARNLRLGQILWMIMNQSGAAGAKLAYRADRDMILVSTAEDLGQMMVVRVYDVQDLISPRLRAAALVVGRVHDIPVGAVPNVAGGAVGVRPVTQRFGSGVYLGDDDPGRLDNDEDDGDPARHMQQLIDAITMTIEPESWAVNGGRGTISSFRWMLIIRNSPFVHQQIIQQIIGGLLSEPHAP